MPSRPFRCPVNAQILRTVPLTHALVSTSAEDLVPDWEGCGRAGRCPDPIWLPAVHPSVRSGSRVLSVAITSRRHRSARRRHVRLLALPPQLRVPRRPGAAAAQSQARSSKRCRGASRCCRHLLEAPSKIVSLVSAGRAEKSLSPKYFSYRKCCLLDNYPCSSV